MSTQAWLLVRLSSDPTDVSSESTSFNTEMDLGSFAAVIHEPTL